MALKTLEGVKHIVLVGSRIPVAFFAYPDKPSLLAPKDTQFTTLSTIEEDSVHALEWLADELGASQQPIEPSRYGPQPLATGKIDSITLAQSIGACVGRSTARHETDVHRTREDRVGSTAERP